MTGFKSCKELFYICLTSKIIFFPATEISDKGSGSFTSWAYKEEGKEEYTHHNKVMREVWYLIRSLVTFYDIPSANLTILFQPGTN